MIPHARVDEWVSIAATAGYRNEIQISGAATVEAGRGATGFTNVFIDPLLAIDPVWAAAHPYPSGEGRLVGWANDRS